MFAATAYVDSSAKVELSGWASVCSVSVSQKIDLCNYLCTGTCNQLSVARAYNRMVNQTVFKDGILLKSDSKRFPSSPVYYECRSKNKPKNQKFTFTCMTYSLPLWAWIYILSGIAILAGYLALQITYCKGKWGCWCKCSGKA